MGESKLPVEAGVGQRVAVDTFGGRVHVEWDPQAAVTPLGQLPFFIEFLKTGGLFEPWVEGCPLVYGSPNAPAKRDVLGTVLLSVLAGHKRYAHITAMRCDGVNPALLGMGKVVSEDAVRRGLRHIEEGVGVAWLKRHLGLCYEPLLQEPWILDVDTTVKPLYGHQEGAVVGYNPNKRGRPSHTYHTYQMANLRLVLDVEVRAGNEGAALNSLPGLEGLLNGLPRSHWPAFVRGDCLWGAERVLRLCEECALDYLFKLRLTTNVKRLIEKAFTRSDWVAAGQGWQGVEERLQLCGWSRERRVVVLRRALKGDIALVKERAGVRQLTFGFVETAGTVKRYEYAVLVTSLADEVLALAQHYRDRADSENSFDELKNHWGWGGFTTHDLRRCRLMARTVALVYNWWSLFVRLANPAQHTEAITSRPLLLQAIGKVTEHAGQTRLTLTSMHAKSASMQRALARIARFLQHLRRTAEQLSAQQRWYYILSRVFVKYLKGRVLKPPDALPAPA